MTGVVQALIATAGASVPAAGWSLSKTLDGVTLTATAVLPIKAAASVTLDGVALTATAVDSLVAQADAFQTDAFQG